jgi:hypothetical protein
MALFQDQVLGQKYLTVIEKVSSENHTLVMHLNFDVPLSRLVKQMAMEFQAGEGYTRVPTGSDVAPTGHEIALEPILEAPRAFVIWGGSPAVLLDQGLSLHENGVKEDDTIELRTRV